MSAQSVLKGLNQKLLEGSAFPMVQGLDRSGEMALAQIRNEGPAALNPEDRPKQETTQESTSLTPPTHGF